MKNDSTNMDVQRVAFIESLHASLHKQTEETIGNHNRFMVLANSYVEDGLSLEESTELLMIDGVSKDLAESYVSSAMNRDSEEGALEYSFQFEDEYGKIWSSYDINKTIKASCENEAWKIAEDIINSDLENYSSRIIAISKID